MTDIADAVIVKPGIRTRIKAAAQLALTPHAVATLALLSGIGLAVAGVYVLAGTGWALLAGALPLLLLSAVLIRGLIRAG